MEYVNATGSWIGAYTPDASAPLGVYSAYVWASDNEGEEAASETFYFTVLNNPPTITSVNVMILGNSILRVIVEAFDYEGLANASLCLYNEGKWLNFTRSFQDNNCIFEIDCSDLKEKELKLFVTVVDKDRAETSVCYGQVIMPSKPPALMFILISLGGAGALTLLVYLLLSKRS